jgi:hypothetical protein
VFEGATFLNGISSDKKGILFPVCQISSKSSQKKGKRAVIFNSRTYLHKRILTTTQENLIEGETIEASNETV